jgi:hypothetical protein
LRAQVDLLQQQRSSGLIIDTSKALNFANKTSNSNHKRCNYMICPWVCSSSSTPSTSNRSSSKEEIISNTDDAFADQIKNQQLSITTQYLELDNFDLKDDCLLELDVMLCFFFAGIDNTIAGEILIKLHG